ncbi:ABC transporter permease [Nocardioides pantholopis]|uniref:ABC transporter permease n=1 Tax=Nocardioides pantholopis TaxID=2483798 RepID=UPI0019D2C4AE|nr:ABC transporter permease [Nocardioides pantholopis]
MTSSMSVSPASVHRADEIGLVRRLASKKLSLFSLIGVALFLLLALVGPFLAPHDPAALGDNPMAAPSGAHWMGTDAVGRDVFSRFLYGSRVSILVGFLAVLVALVLGSLLGMLAGMKSGKWRDTVIMRLMDVVLAFPLLVLVPVITGIIGQRDLSIGRFTIGPEVLVATAIGVVLTPVFARIARASVLAEMREDYVMAVRSFGGRGRDILVRNLLPNIAAPLVVQAAFGLAMAITVEAAVSFLGLGVQPPGASWGTMLADARQYVTLGAWWLVVFPSVAIALFVLVFNLLGDQLRDELDPRAKTGAKRKPAKPADAASTEANADSVPATETHAGSATPVPGAAPGPVEPVDEGDQR